MSVQTVASVPSLPRSHYFVTISRGTAMRTLALRTPLVHALLGLAGVLAIWSMGALLYFVFHDDLVSGLIARQTRLQYAYEDRVGALRNEIEQQASRYLAEEAKLNGKMRELLSREAQLESRTQLVAGLAARTDAPHGPLPDSAAAALARVVPRIDRSPAPGRPPAWPTDAMGFVGSPPAPRLPAGLTKPHPEAEPLFEPDQGPVKPPGRAALDPGEDAAQAGLRDRPSLSLLAARLDRIETLQTASLIEIGTAARSRSARWRDILADVGLAPERFMHDDAPIGGPFVPVPSQSDSAFDRLVAELRGTVAAENQLHAAISHVPLGAPLAGDPDVTSPFGTRVDPFLGRLALHTGVDLREDYGVDVRVTAPGRVTSAGVSGGYGNMVEVDHGNGLRTRYAHLSEIDVVEGTVLPLGGIVGRVGATGRATGPHLHYEVRIDGEPVDPVRFLTAGLHLGDGARP